MNKYSHGISGSKKKLLSSYLQGDEIFLHLKDSLNTNVDAPEHLASESIYSSNEELYFYLRPHISAGYDANKLDSKETFSTGVIYNTRGDVFLCREVLENSKTFCSLKNPYIYYKKWSWIVSDSFKKVNDADSFIYFPKIRILVKFSKDFIVGLLPNTLMTKPGTEYNLREINEIAFKSNSILIPGEILRKIHDAPFKKKYIYKCFFQIWSEDGNNCKANVYCFETFNQNNKMTMPTKKKISFRKKVNVTYFGAK